MKWSDGVHSRQHLRERQTAGLQPQLAAALEQVVQMLA